MRHTTLTLVGSALGAGILYVTWIGQVQANEPPAMSQRTFGSPEQATNALVQAAKSQNRQEVREIFGPEVTNLLTGDAALDEKHFQGFAEDLSQRCVAVPQGNNEVVLEIGKANWPFPIPLVKTNGAWLFDTLAGEEEIINRHIGEDEYYAIGVCRAFVKAENEYSKLVGGTAESPRYADRFQSTPGKTNGLCWQGTINGVTSPLCPFVAQAAKDGSEGQRNRVMHPFYGYVFKILKRQGPAAEGGAKDYEENGELTGGFALVAYPVRWGESGIMTFVVNQDGIVRQSNLGPGTTKTAAAIEEYNPGSQWTVVSDPGISDLTVGESGETR